MQSWVRGSNRRTRAYNSRTGASVNVAKGDLLNTKEESAKFLLAQILRIKDWLLSRMRTCPSLDQRLIAYLTAQWELLCAKLEALEATEKSDLLARRLAVHDARFSDTDPA